MSMAGLYHLAGGSLCSGGGGGSGLAPIHTAVRRRWVRGVEDGLEWTRIPARRPMLRCEPVKRVMMSGRESRCGVVWRTSRSCKCRLRLTEAGVDRPCGSCPSTCQVSPFKVQTTCFPVWQAFKTSAHYSTNPSGSRRKPLLDVHDKRGNANHIGRFLQQPVVSQRNLENNFRIVNDYVSIHKLSCFLRV